MLACKTIRLSAGWTGRRPLRAKNIRVVTNHALFVFSSVNLPFKVSSFFGRPDFFPPYGVLVTIRTLLRIRCYMLQ